MLSNQLKTLKKNEENEEEKSKKFSAVVSYNYIIISN